MAEQYNLVSWLILIIFIGMVILLLTKKVTLLKVLPLSGIIIAIIAGVPLVNSQGEDIVNNVIVKGITDLAKVMLIYVLSMMFAQLVLKYKLNEAIDYLFAYYFAKNKQLIIWVVTLLAIIISSVLVNIGAILFTAILFLPILSQIGLSKPAAITLFLLAEGVGTCLNPLYHSTYAKLLLLPLDYVQNDFYVIAFLTAIALVIYVMVNIYLHKLKTIDKPAKQPIKIIELLIILIPFFMVVLGFNIEIGLFVTIIYGFLLKNIKSPMEEFVALLKETIIKSLDVLILLGAIGIFISAVRTEAVAHAMIPLILVVLPTSPVWCLILFTVLFPFVLYNGPFNLQGMGSGIGTILMGTMAINPLLLGTIFLSLNILSKMADPLSIKNVALFQYTNVNSNDILKRIMPYVLGINYVMLFYMLVFTS